jgi:hypothetical protein
MKMKKSPLLGDSSSSAFLLIQYNRQKNIPPDPVLRFKEILIGFMTIIK